MGLACLSGLCVARDAGTTPGRDGSSSIGDVVVPADTRTGSDGDAAPPPPPPPPPADAGPQPVPHFATDMVPLFNRSCGTSNTGCHARAVYNTSWSSPRFAGMNRCGGWLSLENVPLGSADNSGPRAGMLDGCPDRSLYDRLMGDACQECGSTRMRLVAPGDARNSYLYRKIAGGPYCPFPGSSTPSDPMPMGGSLSAADIDTVRRWIEAGAPQ